MRVGIVEKNIFQDWTEGTQEISVSWEWYLIITDQCYIRETLLFKEIFKTGAAVGDGVFLLEVVIILRHSYVHNTR